MSILVGNPFLLNTTAATGYQVSRSLRFSSGDSSFLSRTPGSSGNKKTCTISAWVKRSKLGSTQMVFTSRGPGNATSGPRDSLFNFDSSDTVSISFADGAYALTTTQVFRDVSAWYHITVAVDTTLASSSDRVKLYVNGSQVTAFSSASYPAQNYEFTSWNVGSQIQYIGCDEYINRRLFFDGYLADIWFLDGIAATPSDFAETNATTGQWVPKTYSGSKGSNGFHLEFADNSAATATTLGKDTANSNNWTPNNFSVTAGAGNDSLVDTPTSYGTDTGVGGEVRGNYATLNPLAKGTTQTLSNGNLDVTGSESGHGTTNATIAVTAGSKVYMEFTRTGGGVGGGWGFASNPVPYSGFPTSGTGIWWVYDNGTNWSYHANGTVTEYSSKTTNGQTLQLAIDYDAGKAWIGINNTWFTSSNATTGNPSTGANPTFTFTTSLPLFPLVESFGWTVSCNFGQRAFAYPVSGFKALCDTNLTAPVIAKPNTAFDIKLYTGNGGTQTVSGLNFSPDWIWFKQRNTTRENHLYDSVRGVQKALYTDLTNAEATDTDALSSFNSDGWTMGADGGSNQNGGTYVAWCWDAGSSAASTNNSGSIQSTVKVNTSAGFSIVTWSSTTGVPHTFGHGLGVAPKFVIVKRRSSTGSWAIGHTSLGWTTKLAFDTSAKAADDSAYWSNTAPTSTVISIGDASNIGGDNIAYCWAPVAGYSSFGSYAGNGSASNGPFIYTGFKPRWVLLKNSQDAGNNWWIIDSARSTYNVQDAALFANSSIAENNTTAVSIDFLSNGFKCRTTDGGQNPGTGSTVIYAAFAENPFQYARAR